MAVLTPAQWDHRQDAGPMSEKNTSADHRTAAELDLRLDAGLMLVLSRRRWSAVDQCRLKVPRSLDASGGP